MKIGVLGYGSIGKRHVKNLEALGHRCYTYDPGNKMTTTRSHVFQQAEAFIIASPTSRHREDILDVAQTSKPCFVEKPIGATNKDWIALKEMARKDRLFIGYNLRFLQNVMKTKEILDSSPTPIWARFTCSQISEKGEYLRDGVILNWSHEIDLALHLIGPGKVVASYTDKVDGKDALSIIIIKHDNGCISTIQIDYLLRPQVRGFTIQCGMADFTCDIDKGTLLIQRNGQPVSLETEMEFNDCYVREMNAFLTFASGGMMRGCTAEQALDVLDICLRVREQAGLEI